MLAKQLKIANESCGYKSMNRHDKKELEENHRLKQFDSQNPSARLVVANTIQELVDAPVHENLQAKKDAKEKAK